MKSSKPYLIRAIYEWIVDSDCIPHLLVDTSLPSVSVPLQYVKDGQIVLNISPFSAVDLVMDDQCISFSARFGGVSMPVYIPVDAVLGIYARENGQGMMFDTSEEAHSSEPPATPPPKKPTLRVIK